MEHEKVERLRKDWADRKCDHPNIESEYRLGKATGNMVCTVCGKSISESVWKRTHKTK
jgi:hypothetical protein